MLDDICGRIYIETKSETKINIDPLVTTARRAFTSHVGFDEREVIFEKMNWGRGVRVRSAVGDQMRVDSGGGHDY